MPGFMFATGIENSYPTIARGRKTVRIDEMEKCGHYRLWREDPVAAANSKHFDELYSYDGLYQLKTFKRGDLSGSKDGIASGTLNFEQQWGLDPLGRMGWAVGFVYLTAAALRLARFNIQVVTDKRYFVGLPSPAAAGLVAATVFYFPGGLQTYPLALAAAAIMVVPALLMVSTIKF